MILNIPKTIESTKNLKLKKFGITLDPGRKSSYDKIIKFHGSALSMEILGKIFAEMCNLQDKLDPKGLGAEYLANYLEEIREAKELTDEIKEKYKVSTWGGNRRITLQGYEVNLEIFGYIYSEMCKIQNLLYPYGKGAKYLAEYLEDIRKNGKLTDEIKSKYKVNH